MLDLTTTQQSIIDSAYKKIDWLFEVRDANGTAYHWSTKDIAASSSQIKWNSESWMPYVRWDSEEDCAYTFAIPDFSGIEMYRNKSEMGLIAPNILTFTVLNPGTTMAPKDFNGGTVRIALKISNGTDAEVIRRWRFVIKKTEPEYQKFRVICEDYLQNLLRGDYPNTRLIREIFDNSDIDARDNICVPIPFGTAYVPLRSVYVDDAVSVTGTDISAVASSNGSRCFIRRSGATDFSEIEWGRYITISGFTEASNNGSFLVSFATADMIQLSESAGLTTEAAGDTVTITQGTRYYVLGDTENTYTISEVRSPRAWGRKSTWALTTYDTSQWATDISWQTYVQWEGGNNFPQATESDGVDNWRMFQPIIADANNDGTADSCGVWRQGEMFLDMPTKFTRSDTSALTSPADILLFILRDMGVPEIDLARIASSKATYSAWGLEWNGALWYKENRKATLSRLLLMCHSNLVAGEAVELHPLSATSQKTITSNYIVKPAEVGEGTFRYQDIRTEQVTDCGYIAWQITGEAQDRFVKALVPASGTTKTRYSKTILDLPWVQDSQDAQRLGTLFFQRSLMGEATVSFIGKASLLALNPGDTVTIDGQNYGGGTVNQVIITGDAGSDPLPRKSLADGQAFFYTSDADLSPYAGTEGLDTPYQVVLHDSAGKIAWGYIGAADAAESLGSELLGNVGFETAGGGGADVWDGWEEFVYDGVFTNETTLVKSGSDAMKNYWDGVTGVRSQLRQIISVTAGKLYKVSFWTRGDGTKDGRWDIYDTTNSADIIAINNTGVTGTTYTEIVRYITAPSGCSQIQIDFYSPVGGTFYVDDVSIKEVTHVDTTGVHIISTLNGSTQGWNEIESGFNYNDAYYRFEVSRRYPVVIDSMRINKDLSIDFSTTKYSCELDDFTDLSPSVITPINDDTTNMWMPSISGPLSDENLASDLVLNVKTFLTVSPSTNKGDYANIQAALNSLKDKNYTGLFFKNGDYFVDTPIYLPAIDMDLVGESRSGVKLYGPVPTSIGYPWTPGPLFSLGLSTGKTTNEYNFTSIGFIARGGGSGGSLLLYKGNSLNVVDCFFSSLGPDGDIQYPIYFDGSQSSIAGKANISRSYFIGNYYAVSANASNVSALTIENNVFDGFLSAIYSYAPLVVIANNHFLNMRFRGVTTDSGSQKVVVNSNVFESATDIYGQTGAAIYIGAQETVITNNVIRIIADRVGPTSGSPWNQTGIYSSAANLGNISGNSIYIQSKAYDAAFGILCSSDQVSILNNTIYIDWTDVGGRFAHGIYISGDRNPINGNTIDMVTAGANTYGIYLADAADYNIVKNNIVKGANDNLYVGTGTGNSTEEPVDGG